MQDDQNGPKIMALVSADMARLYHFVVAKFIFSTSEQPCLSSDANAIMSLPWLPRNIFHFYQQIILPVLKISMLCFHFTFTPMGDHGFVFVDSNTPDNRNALYVVF
jgi:hypothetical protein